MPNQTSLGFEAICDTLHCNHLYVASGGGDIIANDITCVTLEVSGISTTNGINNTGTITTDTLTTTNLDSTNINQVGLPTFDYSVSTSLSIPVNLSPTWNNYHCVLTLNDVSTPTNFGCVFLELLDNLANTINQFVSVTTYLYTASPPTTINEYYPYLLGWFDGDAGGVNTAGSWQMTFDIYNVNTAGRAAIVKNNNMTYNGSNTPSNIAVASTLGNLVNEGYSWGEGPTPGTAGSPFYGPFSALRVLFPNGWAAQGTARLSVCGFN